MSAFVEFLLMAYSTVTLADEPLDITNCVLINEWSSTDLRSETWLRRIDRPSR